MGAQPAVIETWQRRSRGWSRAAAIVRSPTAVQFAPVALAGALWCAALPNTDAAGVSGYGLLAALPATYYLALAVLTVGFALAVTRPQVRPLVLGAHVVALVTLLHATTAILYPEPRYAWTYKHLGVIDYLSTHGAADRSVDIYNNWPGFFALNSWLSKTAGISPLSYAAWAQLFFEFAFVAAVLFALRGLTRDARLRWTAAWLFVVANWIGQDYLAPQAFAFLLALLVLGLVIRCAPWARPPRTRVMWAAVRFANRVGEAARRGRTVHRREAEAPPLSSQKALLFGGLMFLAIVISHQLSPVFVVVSVAVLVATTRRPPVRLLVVMVAIEAWWVFLGYDFVARHFKLFEFDPSVSTRTSLGSGLPGVALGADISRLGILAMVGLAVLGVVRRIAGGRLDAAAAGLAGAPLLVTLFQSYGGEGPLRVYLFALPWLAFFAAAACLPRLRARSVAGRSWRVIAATALIGTATLFGYFGQEPVNYMTHDDVAVSRWYLDHARPGSSLTLLAPNFPERLDAAYSRQLDPPRSLFGTPDLRRGILVRADLPACHGGCDLLYGDALRRYLLKERAPQHYIVVSPSQWRYAHYYGLTDRRGYDQFLEALQTSPDFVLDYRHGDGYVFRLVAGA